MKLLSRISVRSWLALGLLVVDGLFFALTDPANTSSMGLIAGFLLLVITLYWVMLVVFRIGEWYELPVGKHSRRLAGVITGLAGGLMALQSMGELSSRDIIVLMPLSLLAYFYITHKQPGGGGIPGREA